MLLSIILVNIVAAIVAATLFLVRRYDLLSRVFTTLLKLWYPIYDADTGLPMPTLPFIFPNGQGNVAKFLHGHENSIKWGNEYGHIYRIWSGFHGEIVVTRPEDVEAVFRDSHIHLKANANDSGYLMHQLLGSCLGLVSGAEWKNLRRATEPPFLRNAATSYVGAVEEHSKEHIASLAALKSDTSTSWKLEPHGDLRIYPFLALADILYGRLTPDLKERLLAIVPGRDSVFRAMVQGGWTRFPISRFFPFKDIRDLRTFKRDWGHWNDLAHAEAIRKRDTGEAKDDAPVIHMYARVADGSMDREALLQTLDEMLFANLDVSIGGLAWALVFLAAYPRVQDRLVQEIRADLTPETSGTYLLSQSNYLHHVLLESARLRPVVAFSVSQSAPTARRVSNFLLPAGTKFIVDADQLNVRDPLWGPDNTTFRPERWADGGVKRAKDIRYCYWRFGFGPRVCLGKYVVDLMMKALIVELVRGWELRIESEKEWANMEVLDSSMKIACTRRVGDEK
ncbi:cytochrome P450 [Melanomma pulvis-pyrius CBS 109.77]|uniref:Cytochrome P450 n=1 Tax=Melanomma pulvis-pyrius CBS 109.77 TaxID=1314802 RepID=A0A6A6X1W1_9PLEO|nr:cytochrome P450 [Melanomma pulvis-pyrius CBS 109.77]